MTDARVVVRHDVLRVVVRTPGSAAELPEAPPAGAVVGKYGLQVNPDGTRVWFPLEGGAELTLQAFAASSAGVLVGEMTPYTQPSGDFIVRIITTAAAPRQGFIVPPNRRLLAFVRVRDAFDMTARFEVDAGNPRRYVINADQRAVRALYWVRTEATI